MKYEAGSEPATQIIIIENPKENFYIKLFMLMRQLRET